MMSMLDKDTSPRYEETAVIGHGAYGTVYKARDCKNDGQFVALKKIRIQTTSEEGMPMSTIRELSMLRLLPEHKNVVKLLDVVHGNRARNEMSLWLVFEHIDMDLAKYLEKCPSPGLGPEKIKDLFYQILNGVDFLHSNRIIHRDLKPQNILVTGKGQIKIADFGLARAYGFSMALTNVVVTLWYRSPEVLLQDQYASAVDMWSCGCIFAELHTRRPLFCGQSERDQLIKIFDIIGLPPEEEWPLDIPLAWDAFQRTPSVPLERLIPEIEPRAKQLLQELLIFKQGDRTCARKALQHNYFTSILEEMVAETNLSDSHCSSMSEQESTHSVSLDLDDSLKDNQENLENMGKRNLFGITAEKMDSSTTIDVKFDNTEARKLENGDRSKSESANSDALKLDSSDTLDAMIDDFDTPVDNNGNNTSKLSNEDYQISNTQFIPLEKPPVQDTPTNGSETESCASTPRFVPTPQEKVGLFASESKFRSPFNSPFTSPFTSPHIGLAGSAFSSPPFNSFPTTVPIPKLATPNELLLQCNENSLDCDEVILDDDLSSDEFNDKENMNMMHNR